MDISMDIHMEMPIKSKVSKLDGSYMNRTQHLPRPSAQEQQPECRRPMEEEKE